MSLPGKIHVHPSADVSSEALIGENTQIWHQAQVREKAKVGRNCILGKGVYIDASVVVGSNVKIQNYVSLFNGVTLEDGVFVGPHVCFTNDLRPRAINPNGSPKSVDDWILTETLVKEGAAIGANSTILCGITIGRWAMIGAGSVVTHDIPDYGLVWGVPARIHGFVCPCGYQLHELTRHEEVVEAGCEACGRTLTMPSRLWS